jgi:hypothetical protein
LHLRLGGEHVGSKPLGQAKTGGRFLGIERPTVGIGAVVFGRREIVRICRADNRRQRKRNQRRSSQYLHAKASRP